jgi:uncharacterized protein
MPTDLSAELVQRVVAQHTLSPFSLHGVPHWARVLDNGRRLARLTGARDDVVQLFAIFHDACRETHDFDEGHGRRGADLAKEVRGDWFELDDHGMFALWEACAYHSDGRNEHSDPTVATCWDADRLDLARVGITPDPRRLCTKEARIPLMLDWAVGRGREKRLPSWVADRWGVVVPTS